MSGAAATEIEVLPLRRLDLSYAPFAWRFAKERRAEIDVHFRKLQRDKPALWNGRVLLLREPIVESGVLRGSFFDTDFASFLALRDWNFPDPSVRNCFAMAALQTCDGAFALGLMGAHTANAGKIYFPCGTPDLDDVQGGRVDLHGSVLRELEEETGLGSDEVEVAAGWDAVFAGAQIALMKRVRARETRDALHQRFTRHIAGQTQPELARIDLVRGPAELDPRVLPFVAAYLRHRWAADPT